MYSKEACMCIRNISACEPFCLSIHTAGAGLEATYNATICDACLQFCERDTFPGESEKDDTSDFNRDICQTCHDSHEGIDQLYKDVCEAAEELCTDIKQESIHAARIKVMQLDCFQIVAKVKVKDKISGKTWLTREINIKDDFCIFNLRRLLVAIKNIK